MFQTSAVIKYMKIVVRKLFKMANKITQISNSFSNQPVMHVTMDVSSITQSNIQHSVIKIINTTILIVE